MAQLNKWQSKQLYPVKSNKVYFLIHTLNGGKALRRCLKSVLPLTKNIIVLIDDRSNKETRRIAKKYSKYTETFKWRHSFSYAKNKTIEVAREKAGLKDGDWIFTMGSDFVLQYHTVGEIKRFVKDPLNFFAEFNVPEHHPKKGAKVVSRVRKLLVRLHPFIYWEKSVHEELSYSVYQLTGIGIPFGNIDRKKPKLLGGMNGLVHHGFFEDGGEYGKVFWRKKGYYRTLSLIDAVRFKYNFPETFIGTWNALMKILNRYVDPYEMDEEIARLAKRYQKGDFPMGLSKYRPLGIFDYDL